MTALAFVFKLGSIIFFTLAWWCYTPPPVVPDTQCDETKNVQGPESTDVSVIQSPSLECNVGLANGHTNLTEVLEIDVL